MQFNVEKDMLTKTKPTRHEQANSSDDFMFIVTHCGWTVAWLGSIARTLNILWVGL